MFVPEVFGKSIIGQVTYWDKSEKKTAVNIDKLNTGTYQELVFWKRLRSSSLCDGRQALKYVEGCLLKTA